MTDLLMNAWYMGGWSDEVTGRPLARRLLGVGMLFFRKQDGTAAALRDRCPHRFAPLSQGKVIDDCVQCPYHGLLFDASGQCVANPLEARAPSAVRVQAFPVAERDRIIWFWPGEPGLADTSLLPDFGYLSDNVHHQHVFGRTPVAAHFELETDNLMDLSHVNMLHPPFAGVLSPASRYTAKRKGDTVHSHWVSEGAPNPPVFELGLFPTAGALIDQWIEMRWNAPGAMYLDVSVTRSGEARSAGYTLPSVHILTPETERTTHYFWSAALRAEDRYPLELFRDSFIQAFDNEDKPMIELVAAEMGEETDLLAMKPLLLRSDAGAVLARRVLAEMVARERREPAFGVAAE